MNGNDFIEMAEKLDIELTDDNFDEVYQMYIDKESFKIDMLMDMTSDKLKERMNKNGSIC